MTFNELLEIAPDLEECTANMPEHIKQNFTFKRFPPQSIIHQKDTEITSFGIVCSGRHRVINEFANGNIFMIEKNSAISFLGEVALLAGCTHSSVTIETITECLVMFIPLADFEEWIGQDISFLRRLTRDVSRKLYNTSYIQGERQYYSVRYVTLKYILEQTSNKFTKARPQALLRQTRQQMSEEMGLTIKTLNRTVANLKEAGFLDIQKGKIAINASQYEKIEKALHQYIKQSKRGGELELP